MYAFSFGVGEVALYAIQELLERIEEAGEHELKGVPERWRIYRVVHG